MTIQTVDSLRSVQWLEKGWRGFVKHFNVWLAQATIISLFILLIGTIADYNMLVFDITMPILMAGLLITAHKIFLWQQPNITDLFLALFHTKTRNSLLALSAILLFSSLFGKIILPFSPWGDVIYLCLHGGLIILCLHAIPLILFQKMQPIIAIKKSLQALKLNLFPIVIFILIYFGLVFIAVIPVGLGLLVLTPVMAGAIYAAYREIFSH